MAGQDLELLYGPNLRGPMSTRTSEQTHPWSGLATINSGSAYATVSTALVKSGALIFHTVYPGSVAVAAQSHGMLVVNSIVDNTSFALAWATDLAASWNVTVGWHLMQTKR